MSTKAKLTELLAETGGSARHKRLTDEQSAPPKPKAAPQKGREQTVPSPSTFPSRLRDQLKILAVQNGKTLHGLVAEAFNDLFAKHGKPGMAPTETTQAMNR